MLYKYETHMHSKEGSACSKTAAADMVRAYHAAGYAGGILTNHFIFGFTSVPRDLPWEERMKLYYDAYLLAKPVADELDFDLHFGMEHLYGNSKEILVYGIPFEFWRDNPDIPEISVIELGSRIHAAGGYISHAHPYRARAYCPPNVEPTIEVCDAAEVYNFSDPPEINAKAEALALRLGIQRTSGADSHNFDFEGIGMAGMAFPSRLHTTDELLSALRSGEGRLIIDGEIK